MVLTIRRNGFSTDQFENKNAKKCFQSALKATSYYFRFRPVGPIIETRLKSKVNLVLDFLTQVANYLSNLTLKLSALCI